MNVRKLRAASLVFLVGFALGLSVFAASRLVVRSVLSADAAGAAAELAAHLAAGGTAEIGNLNAVARYAYFDPAGDLVETGPRNAGGAEFSGAELNAARAAAGEALVSGIKLEQAPLAPILLGFAEPAVDSVSVPVAVEGQTIGSLYVEVDQTLALNSLTRAFSLIGIATIALAVLAMAIILLAAARSLGQRGRFDPAGLPRDRLTGLPTREGFVAALGHAVDHAKKTDAQLGLMIVNLDGFRTVNDVWGHSAGDQVLKAAADRLRPFAAGACLSRISGDDFALLVDKDANSHGLRQLAAKIQAAVGAPYGVSGSSILLGATIGVALYPVNADSAENLFRAADVALSKAKREGRGSLTFFDTEMRRRMQRRSVLDHDLRQALDRGEFVVFYQPQLELASGRIRGYEALVRWERPGEGILAPREFLPIAEETGLIRPLGEWVLRKACIDAASWTDGAVVAVNFSPPQFRVPGLDKVIAEILADTGLPAERLEIEVPEALFLDNSSDLLGMLRAIKALGVRVAMDNFGAGYTGLASLAQFPFDKVKIDRSFVGQLAEDSGVAAIVASIVALGRSLSLDITAEGVETNDQVTLLRAAGCNIVQGFLFGAPQRETVSAPESDEQASASRA